MARAAAWGVVVLWLAPAPAAAQPAGQSCVDVRIGAEQYYNCLNRDLARAVPDRRFSAADAPHHAGSAPYSIGGFNQTATRQMLGRNFGRSVFPERPPR